MPDDLPPLIKDSSKIWLDHAARESRDLARALRARLAINATITGAVLVGMGAAGTIGPLLIVVASVLCIWAIGSVVMAAAVHLERRLSFIEQATVDARVAIFEADPTRLG